MLCVSMCVYRFIAFKLMAKRGWGGGGRGSALFVFVKSTRQVLVHSPGNDLYVYKMFSCIKRYMCCYDGAEVGWVDF